MIIASKDLSIPMIERECQRIIQNLGITKEYNELIFAIEEINPVKFAIILTARNEKGSFFVDRNLLKLSLDDFAEKVLVPGIRITLWKKFYEYHLKLLLGQLQHKQSFPNGVDDRHYLGINREDHIILTGLIMKELGFNPLDI